MAIPIILHHGFMDVINFHVGPVDFHSFQGIDRALMAAGHRVIRTRVHPTGSIARRAAALKQQVLLNLRNERRGTRALIVAHSMGGLDARFMISRLGMADRIAGLLTVATPHHGSAFADYMVSKLNRIHGARLFKMLHLDMQGVSDLTLKSADRFNAQTPDMAGVRYFSVSAACTARECPAWGRQSFRVIEQTEGPNDGLVSVKSAIHADHLGTWHADHWALLNKSFGRGAESDIVDLYMQSIRKIAMNLAI